MYRVTDSDCCKCVVCWKLSQDIIDWLESVHEAGNFWVFETCCVTLVLSMSSASYIVLAKKGYCMCLKLLEAQCAWLELIPQCLQWFITNFTNWFSVWKTFFFWLFICVVHVIILYLFWFISTGYYLLIDLRHYFTVLQLVTFNPWWSCCICWCVRKSGLQKRSKLCFVTHCVSVTAVFHGGICCAYTFDSFGVQNIVDIMSWYWKGHTVAGWCA